MVIMVITMVTMVIITIIMVIIMVIMIIITGMEVIESIDDLSVFCDKISINSTQKISSSVLNSRNMMSVARTSLSTLQRRQRVGRKLSLDL